MVIGVYMMLELYIQYVYIYMYIYICIYIYIFFFGAKQKIVVGGIGSFIHFRVPLNLLRDVEKIHQLSSCSPPLLNHSDDSHWIEPPGTELVT